MILIKTSLINWTLLLIGVFIVTMIFRNNNIQRPFASTMAWIPQRLSRSYKQGVILGGMESRLGNDIRTFTILSKLSHGPSQNYGRKALSASVQENTPQPAAVEAMNYTTYLCGDELSSQACSTFGGIKYYNTDIDERFRVLFVLGGPGAYRIETIEDKYI
jgi:hypothetical protein